MYLHDFLFSRDRLRVLGLEGLSEGFWVTDLTSRSMISSVASSWELVPSSLATDIWDGLTLPRPVDQNQNQSLNQMQTINQIWTKTQGSGSQRPKESSHCDKRRSRYRLIYQECELMYFIGHRPEIHVDWTYCGAFMCTICPLTVTLRLHRTGSTPVWDQSSLPSVV